MQERFEQMQTRLKDTATELKKKDEMIAQLRTTQQQLHRRNVVLESLYKTGSMPPASASATASAPALAFPVAPARLTPTSNLDPGPSLLQMLQNRSPPVAAVVLPGATAPFPEMVSLQSSKFSLVAICGIWSSYMYSPTRVL